MKNIIIMSALSLALTGCQTVSNLGKKIGIGDDAPKAEVTTKTPTSAATQVQTENVDISGEWTIIGVNDKEINQDEEMPYVTFVPGEKRFYASNGCNILNGDYILSGSTISFSHVLATQKYCPGVNYDSEINSVLADGNSLTVQVKAQNQATFLYLIDANGRTLISMSRQNLSWLNGQWDVVTINGHTADRAEANIFFDIASLKVHGNTGCNYFNGTLHVDPLEAGNISFSGMGVTRMACPDQDFERAMLVALEEVTKVEQKNGLAVLCDANGNQLLTLKPAIEKGE